MWKTIGLTAAILLTTAPALTARAATVDRSGSTARPAPSARTGPVHRHVFRRDRAFGRRAFFAGWPYGWWPPYDAPSDYLYAAAAPANYPPPPFAVGQAAAPLPVCPVLLHWDEKLGHETRERLCD